jgi:hypothetical protein
MSIDIPTPSQQPYPPPASKPPDNRSRNLLMAVVVSVVIVCIGLFVVAQLANRDKIGKSDYPVKSFAVARTKLGIEPVPQWQSFDGSDFTVYLPKRFEPLSDSVQPSPPDLSGGQVLLIAADTANTTFGTNIMLMAMPASSDMTPGKYAWGTADEMKKGGYQIKDKSAYDLSGRSVGRLIYETTTLSGQLAAGVQFAIIENDTLWVIIGTVPSRDLSNWLPVLQEIMLRFRIGNMYGLDTST